MTSASVARASSEGSLVDGEFAFSLSDFQSIADLVKTGSGIDLPRSKAMLVYSRLARRVRENKLRSFAEYCNLVRENSSEKSRMISALTTNVTRFFREPHHFEHLRSHVIEPLAQSARGGNKIRLWSAACSTGQEPYSIALTVLSAIPEAAKLDVKVLATDLNPFVVEHGRRGIYEPSELADIPQQLRSRWFELAIDASGGQRIGSEARALVSFREMNLMERWPVKGPFDAIFCRNVVIYFDRETQERMWSGFAGVMRDGSVLYAGHSERVTGADAHRLISDGITTYVFRRGGK
jgi:chemotaxis protein methyltransferase CheR